MRVISVCLIVVSLLLASILPVFAQGKYQFSKVNRSLVEEALQKIVPVRFLPGNPLYFLISAKEAFSRFFQPSAKERAQFDFVLSGKRLKETCMILKKGDLNGASNNLEKYAYRNKKTVEQIEKARAQNQAIEPAVATMTDFLRFHENLLAAIGQMRPDPISDYGFDNNYKSAVDSFRQLVLKIDNIQPGVKNRFEITKDDEASSSPKIVEPTPTPTPFEASPSYK